MAFTLPYKQKNYLGEHANDAGALTALQAYEWDSNGNGTGDPQNGMWYYRTSDHKHRAYQNGSWETIRTDVFGTEYADQVSAAVSTTTSTTFQQKMRLSVSTIPAGRYRLEVSYMWNHDSIANDFEARVQQDDTTDLYFHKEEPTDSLGSFGATGTNQRVATSKTILLDLAAGDYDFDLDYRTDSGGDESSIWDAVMTFWRVS